jgi:hypothetical protein
MDFNFLAGIHNDLNTEDNYQEELVTAIAEAFGEQLVSMDQLEWSDSDIITENRDRGGELEWIKGAGGETGSGARADKLSSRLADQGVTVGDEAPKKGDKVVFKNGIGVIADADKNLVIVVNPKTNKDVNVHPSKLTNRKFKDGITSWEYVA